jgi:hypothetical protein
MGPLDKPSASLALLPSRASSHTCSNPELLAPQRRYEAIQLWSYTTFIVNEEVVIRKLAVETYRVKTNMNINYDVHKKQLLITNNHCQPKQNQKYWRRQNIDADKTLVPTKHWRRQNIGMDKKHASTILLALTKDWRQQNTGVN